MTKSDSAKNGDTAKSNSAVARKVVESKPMADTQKPNSRRVFSRLPLRKSEPTDLQVAKHPVTKEPPLQEIIATGNLSEAATSNPMPIRIADFSKQPTPVKGSEVITVRSDEIPPIAASSEPQKEKSITLKSVHFKFGASADYTVLVGRVQEFRKTLRLRYAAVEQEDKHGGSVVLEGNEVLQKLRDGQHVRIRGTIIAAEDRLNSARFRVDAIEVID